MSDGPTTQEVADRLNTNPVDLVYLTGYHSPSTGAELVELTGGEPEHEDAVEAWLRGATIDVPTGGRRQGGDGPTAKEVAEALDVPRRRLLQFTDFHPNPTPEALLGWARADPGHEPVVAAWLDSRRTERPDFSGADPVARDDNRRGRLVR